MRAPFRFPVACSVALGIALSAGCTRTTTNAVDNTAADPADDELPSQVAVRSDVPYIRGPITSRSSESGRFRVLVKAAPKTANGEPAAWVFPTGATLVWRDGSPATVADLRQGRKVVVWITGPVLESLPPQATASAILIDR